MGIEILERPVSDSNAGIFTLPAEFDSKRFAAHWVKKGQAVNVASQREHLLGTQFTADGWTIWKKPGGGNTPTVVPTSTGDYILMCRPKEVQDQVNKIYGNVSIQRLLSEKQTSAQAAQQPGASGMLSDEQLRAAGYKDQQMQDEAGFTLNRVNFAERVAQTPIEVTSTKAPEETE